MVLLVSIPLYMQVLLTEGQVSRNSPFYSVRLPIDALNCGVNMLHAI